MLRLHLHATSPFAWKVLVAAGELGLLDEIELRHAQAHPVRRDLALVALNPIGQVPTLETPDGVLVDSRVICEWLDARAGGGRWA
jgi:glutathione S-transferase